MRRSRGLTLPELAVACLVFGLAMVAIIGIERVSRQASRHEELRTDTYRQAMLTIEHLRHELRGARVTELMPTRLSYRTPRRNAAGEPLLDASGAPLWEPSDSTAFTISMNPAGNVVKTSPTEPDRVLGHLGNGGKLTFLDMDPSRTDLVEIMVKAWVYDSERASEYTARFKVYFANQP